MTNSPRFKTPILSSRPRGARIIEVYSPKLGRRLQCFGENAFRQWIRLEADPLINTFCERPAYLGQGVDERLADFWVGQEAGETILVIDEKLQLAEVKIGDDTLPVRTIMPIELVAAHVWISNWERMLPTIISCRQLLSQSNLNTVLKFISEPMQLSRIERELNIGDPTIVRAAIFTLLHRGQLQSPQLKTEPLSFLTCFESADIKP